MHDDSPDDVTPCVRSRMKGGTFCTLQLSLPCSGEGGGRTKLLCQIWPQLMEEVG